MENIENTAEAQEIENVESPEAEVKKPSIGTRIKQSRPVGAIKRHWKGAVAGAAGAAAVIGAAVLAGKMANDQLAELPFDVDGVTDVIPDVGGDAEA